MLYLLDYIILHNEEIIGGCQIVLHYRIYAWKFEKWENLMLKLMNFFD